MLIGYNKGFSLITVIIMLIILGSASAYMITIYSAQQNLTNARLQAVRGKFAADAGIAYLKSVAPAGFPSCKKVGSNKNEYSAQIQKTFNNPQVPGLSDYPPEYTSFEVEVAVYCIGCVPNLPTIACGPLGQNGKIIYKLLSNSYTNYNDQSDVNYTYWNSYGVTP